MRAGTRLGPYEIVAAIGAGGMGEVYKARDERLARDVAIKLLAAHSTDSTRARERFKREAQAVAALQHPNICTIYDVGETADGRAFIVMELLQGETLQQRIAHGPLDLRVILEIGAALADALQAAHAAGIVHRDIKPANILLTSRGPKILDFGLVKADPRVPPGDAAAAELETRALLTDAGSAVGTLAYMSPEQLRGEEVDARTDLFSFGLVLYEMATGRPAFAGSSAVVGAAILHQQPTPLRTIRPDLPEGFEQVVLKALEKDRQLRYQTAADIRADLQRQKRSTDQNAAAISAVAAPPPRRSKRALLAGTAAALAAVIAAGYWAFSRPGTPKLTETDTIVLGDFTNTTGDAVFDEALRQGLIVQLQQSPFLHVLPDQRVRRVLTMMGLPPDARLTPAVALEVCERSSSAAVIEGSIASLGNQYVLGLRATDCRSGEVLDTQQSQVPGKENVLSALSGMARAFRARVGESLATIQTHEKPLEEATTASIEALKAYSATRAPGFGGCDARIPLLERAVELDPEFALAHAGLGVCYSGTGRRELAIQSATRAYELRQRTTDPERFNIEYAYRPRRHRRSRKGIPDRHAMDTDLSSRSQCVGPARWLQRAWHRQVRGCDPVGAARPGDRSRFCLCPQRVGLGQHVSGPLRCGQARAPARGRRGRSGRACARLLHRDAGARHRRHRAVGRAIQGIVQPPAAATRPVARPGSRRTARAREDARARGHRRRRRTRPTRDRGDLRIGGRGVGSVVGKSVSGQAACGDGPQ